ncbi:sensor histidine kinase [Paenibacillus motobuensis]|uniref:sensor histidine kinase n=1 Tax=Paenibacillus TaxID=44249 RepID=UPI00203AD016|nr:MULTISPECIES: sensor histidine kinase [Paenibacillus]MCM3041152.1 sensor histidine kinase [Paenibacillus lutimineralis]MCM3648256.1 sensor histidine kinase [Paenibacillus motobuensis]
MIRKFLIERRSWIILFLCLQLLSLSMAFLDPDIPVGPLLYVTFISAIIFVIFLAIRYSIEIRFYRSLEEWDPHLDLNELSPGSSPFEQIVQTHLYDQTERLRQESALNRSMLEAEKDELLSWIHDVKTPLTAMQLMIERLDDHTAQEQLTYEWLRIHLLLDRQLHQKRIPFMENDLFIEQVELKSLLSQEIRTLRPWCMRRGIGFDVDLEIREVLSDAKWLAFIVRQLLTNAVKYSENADIVITSYLHSERPVLEIRDNGRGIDPKDLPRIFDKGFTSTLVHNDPKATGMGLYLARRAAQPLHIRVKASSQPGEGTSMKLIFPTKNEFVQIRGM